MNVFQQLCKKMGVPVPVTEYKFHPDRRWRADYAWPEHKLILEVEGGVFTGGRHTSGAGFIKDCEKYNAMTVQGFRLLRVVPKHLHSAETIQLIKKSIHD